MSRKFYLAYLKARKRKGSRPDLLGLIIYPAGTMLTVKYGIKEMVLLISELPRPQGGAS
jgi:hypothetical protein